MLAARQVVNKMAEERPKKKKYWVVGFIVLILILGGFMNYKYIQNAKRAQYVQGGSDAVSQIIEAVKLSGGVTLEIDENETIILAKYNKAQEPTEINAKNYTVPQTTTPPITDIPPLTNSSA